MFFYGSLRLSYAPESLLQYWCQGVDFKFSKYKFLAFNEDLYPHKLEGMFFSLFVIAVAASEAALQLL